MKFIENLTKDDIEELLNTINLKLIDFGENKILKCFENKKENEKFIIIFYEKLNKDYLDEYTDTILNKLNLKNSYFNNFNALMLTNFELKDNFLGIDFSDKLYEFVMNSEKYDNKFKASYKKAFIRFYKKQDLKENTSTI